MQSNLFSHMCKVVHMSILRILKHQLQKVIHVIQMLSII
jgi:hypothetical protein